MRKVKDDTGAGLKVTPTSVGAKTNTSLAEEVAPHRRRRYPAHALFVNRWSPRAMSGEALRMDELMALFEAARWAPSSYNNQPWRFLYAMRETEHWPVYFDLLFEFNQAWAHAAAVLILVISKKTFDNGKPSRTHSFDTGAAWENLALEGTLRGLVVHGIEGFHHEKARRMLQIPDDYNLEAMVAVGISGHTSELPGALRQRESPSSRKNLAELVMEGTFRSVSN